MSFVSLRSRWLHAAHNLHASFQKYLNEIKYRPDQPRVPAGSAHGGQWSAEHINADTSDPALFNDVENNASDLHRILSSAKLLAVSRASMSRCVDLCLPLLGRRQLPGSDRNEFDFRKCLNACLGLNR